jgi:hypothetical protein
MAGPGRRLSLLSAFQVLQQLKTLPDFLIFPTFLALRHQDCFTFTLPESLLLPDREIIYAVKALMTSANEEQGTIQSSSDALNSPVKTGAYISGVLSTCDEVLIHIFQAFWNRHLLFWL